MEAELIKEQLEKLYSENWAGYIENVRKVTDSAYPFLIHPLRSYCESLRRIMICGQETQGWGNELDGMNPDVILFLTGPNYDWRIKSVLGSFAARPVADGMFIDRLSFSDSSLPPALRTYHPGYIQRQGMFQQYAETIAREISSIIGSGAR